MTQPSSVVVGTNVAATEKQWQRTVLDAAHILGYRCYHTELSKWSNRGFPDLVLVGSSVLFVELKSEKGKTTAEQDAWLADLSDAGALAFLWRPRDWNDVERVLAEHRPIR